MIVELKKFKVMLYYVLVSSFCIYLTIMVILYGIPPSLSDTYYRLPEKWGKPFWFMLFTFWGLCCPILTSSGFMALSGFGLIIVGAAPLFKLPDIKPVHFAGAGIAAVGIVLWLISIKQNALVYTILGLLVLVLITVKANKTFWLEMALFFPGFVGIFVYLSR